MTGNRAQTLLEYSLLISVAVVTLIGMYLYISRGMRGRLWETANYIDQAYYQPGKVISDSVSNFTVTEQANRNETTTTVNTTTIQEMTINETVLP